MEDKMINLIIDVAINVIALFVMVAIWGINIKSIGLIRFMVGIFALLVLLDNRDGIKYLINRK
jgi:hypothetical protein